MKITKQRLKKLEEKATIIYNPVEMLPLIWNEYKKQHPELTDEQIDEHYEEFYKKTGIRPIKIKFFGDADNKD